jgi:hypothetical protein
MHIIYSINLVKFNPKPKYCHLFVWVVVQKLVFVVEVNDVRFSYFQVFGNHSFYVHFGNDLSEVFHSFINGLNIH